MVLTAGAEAIAIEVGGANEVIVGVANNAIDATGTVSEEGVVDDIMMGVVSETVGGAFGDKDIE